MSQEEEKFYKGVKVTVCPPADAKGVLPAGYSCAGRGSASSLARGSAKAVARKEWKEKKRREREIATIQKLERQAKLRKQWEASRVTEKQRNYLHYLGLQAPKTMSKETATRHITEALKRKAKVNKGYP